jgi:hypothetical protein
MEPATAVEFAAVETVPIESVIVAITAVKPSPVVVGITVEERIVAITVRIIGVIVAVVMIVVVMVIFGLGYRRSQEHRRAG